MDLLIAGLIAGGLISAGAHLLARRRKKDRQQSAKKALPEAPRTVAQARPKDVLIYDGEDLIVSGVASYSEGSRDWSECCCEGDGSNKRWVVLGEGDPDGALVGEGVEAIPILDRPPESIDHQGEIYRLESHGHAKLTVIGELDPSFEAGEAEYWTYARPGSARFWIRKTGATHRCFAGQRTRRHLIEFIAA